MACLFCVFGHSLGVSSFWGFFWSVWSFVLGVLRYCYLNEVCFYHNMSRGLWYCVVIPFLVNFGFVLQMDLWYLQLSRYRRDESSSLRNSWISAFSLLGLFLFPFFRGPFAVLLRMASDSPLFYCVQLSICVLGFVSPGSFYIFSFFGGGWAFR